MCTILSANKSIVYSITKERSVHMTSGRRYDTARPASKKSRQFFIHGKQKAEQHCCTQPAREFNTKHCHQCNKCNKCCKCSEHRKEFSKDHSKKSPFDYYFSNNPDATVLQ